ncbi:amidohydrolase family protein [Maribacter chungangensis]|uniref:Amidohydrolase family protein n=1 Tax=Maribacter chungangensis TaxID=1069117 RepID=A0ABW3B6N3_9FLAO
MRLDSHQHFWNYNAKRHSWMDETMLPLRKDFMPNDLKPLLQARKIDGCIAVQVDQTEAETSFLLDLAAEHEFIKGIVGWLDLRSDTIEERLHHFVKNPYLKGIRHILQSEPDDFVLGKTFCNGIAKLEQFSLTYDILIFPQQLKNTISFIEKFPDQKFVLNHLAKPDIKSQKIKEWEKELQILAQHPNVYCKVSGMVTEADWSNWNEDDFKPYMDVVFGAFGTHRTMYGSDWPVCLLASGYEGVFTIVNNYITQFTREEQLRIMGGNAVDFYDLPS